jgi:hypothetical protein
MQWSFAAAAGRGDMDDHFERDKRQKRNAFIAAGESPLCWEQPDWRRVSRGASPGPSVSNSLPGGHSEREPPDPIPNSEVKTPCADGSVPFRHARVGHCQALIRKNPRGP